MQINKKDEDYMRERRKQTNKHNNSEKRAGRTTNTTEKGTNHIIILMKTMKTNANMIHNTSEYAVSWGNSGAWFLHAL